MYGPNDDSLRDLMWAEMWAEFDSMRLQWTLAWCLFGVFIIIKYLIERLGCNSFSPALFKFLDFIEKHLMVDLPLVGGEYTWFRDSDNPSMSKIDSVGVSGLGGAFLRFDPKDTPLGWY